MANATTTSSNLAKNSLRVKQPEELLARPAAVTTSTTSSRSSSTSSSECGVHVAEVDTFPSTVPPCTTTAFPTSNTGGCVMYVHLVSSICTEWQHTSMVLSEDNLPGTVSIASLLQSLGKKQEKRPKTIHRCILQKMTSLDSNSLAKRINCHVCGEAYATYKCYLDHLLDKSCERAQNRSQQHTPTTVQQEQPEVQIEAEVINGRKRVIGKLEEEEEDGDTPSTTADHSSFKKFQIVQTSVSVDENIENVVKSTVSSASESGGPYTVQPPPPPPTEENHEPSCCEQKSSPNFGGNGSGGLSRIEASVANLCPHFAAATQQTPVTLKEFVDDQAQLSHLKGQMTTLLAGIMGEEKLTALGYPDKNSLHILKTLLEMARCPILHSTEGCTKVCRRLETILSPIQVKYRLLKCELIVARMNINRLLQICIPDKEVWMRSKWHEKRVEDILSDIISDHNGYLTSSSSSSGPSNLIINR